MVCAWKHVCIYVAFHGACVCNVNTHLVQLYRLFFLPLTFFFLHLSADLTCMVLRFATLACLHVQRIAVFICHPVPGRSKTPIANEQTKKYIRFTHEKKKFYTHAYNHKCQCASFFMLSFMKIVVTYIDTLHACKKGQPKVKKQYRIFTQISFLSAQRVQCYFFPTILISRYDALYKCMYITIWRKGLVEKGTL